MTDNEVGWMITNLVRPKSLFNSYYSATPITIEIMQNSLFDFALVITQNPGRQGLVFIL